MIAACWDCPSIGGACAICPRTGRTPPEEFTPEQRAKLAEFDRAPDLPESWAGQQRMAAGYAQARDRLADQERQAVCGAVSPRSGVVCDERPGHYGDHSNLHGNPPTLYRWPAADPDQERRQNLTGLRDEVVAGAERALLVERLEALADRLEGEATFDPNITRRQVAYRIRAALDAQP